MCDARAKFKPIVFLTFSLSSASLDLKVPNVVSKNRSQVIPEFCLSPVDNQGLKTHEILNQTMVNTALT